MTSLTLSLTIVKHAQMYISQIMLGVMLFMQ